MDKESFDYTDTGSWSYGPMVEAGLASSDVKRVAHYWSSEVDLVRNQLTLEARRIFGYEESIDCGL